MGFREIGEALDEINRLRDRSVGRLRLNILSDSARLIMARHLPKFLNQFPEVKVEISVDDRMVDIVSEGFDAGIRFGGTSFKHEKSNRCYPNKYNKLCRRLMNNREKRCDRANCNCHH